MARGSMFHSGFPRLASSSAINSSGVPLDVLLDQTPARLSQAMNAAGLQGLGFYAGEFLFLAPQVRQRIALVAPRKRILGSISSARS